MKTLELKSLDAAPSVTSGASSVRCGASSVRCGASSVMSGASSVLKSPSTRGHVTAGIRGTSTPEEELREGVVLELKLFRMLCLP
eukprot:2662020-Pyramimonas_sp.AAC.1